MSSIIDKSKIKKTVITMREGWGPHFAVDHFIYLTIYTRKSGVAIAWSLEGGSGTEREETERRAV